MRYRGSGRIAPRRSVFFRAPGLLIAALTVGASGGMTLSDLLASWNGSGAVERSCDIKGNVSIDTGERIFHVPGQAYYSEARINPRYRERWFCSEFEAWAAGWRKARQ